MVPRVLPSLKPEGEDRLVYAPPSWYRFGAGGAAILLGFIGRVGLMPVIPSLLWFGLAFLLALAALSDDRWIFRAAGEGAPARAERRFGVFPFQRSWSLEAARVSCVELRSGAAGESVVDRGGAEGVMETSLLGTGRGPWTALVLVLDDRRTLAVAAGRPRHAAGLHRDGERVAALLGLPFVDSRAPGGGGGEETPG